VAALVLGMCRAAGFILVAPPFNTRNLPAAARAVMALVLTIALMPTIRDDLAGQDTLGVPLLIGAAVSEVAIGAALGFLVALLFTAVQMAGDLIDVTSGLALQPAFDPQAMTMHSSIGKLHSLMATTLLFTSGAHLILVRGFTQSYEALPIGGGLPTEDLGPLLIHGISTMFLSALQIAGPMIAVLFLTDVALALLSKAAPALNIFAVGLPLKTFVVLGLLALTIPLLPAAVHSLVEQGVRSMLHLAGGG
jgi:flagellar biosynthetic protein FliR